MIIRTPSRSFLHNLTHTTRIAGFDGFMGGVSVRTGNCLVACGSGQVIVLSHLEVGR